MENLFYIIRWIILNDERAKCQETYILPKEAEAINISDDEKIWLRFNDHIYGWNLKTGKIMIVSTI